MSEELQKQAQAKLSEARRLINEAGELAKEGQFALHFGETGDFVPRAYFDRELLRPRATALLESRGRQNHALRIEDPTIEWGYRYEEVPNTPWAELDESERASAIEEEIDGLREEMNVPYEFQEYGSAKQADRWWAPSRC